MIFAGKHSKRDKHLLRLERELDRLHRAQWTAPVIPLEHPYQRGWVKTYTLREDARHHPEARIFAEVLPVVNRGVHSVRRDFMRANGHAIVLRPQIIEWHTWRKLAWSFRHQRLFLYGRWPVERFYSWSDHCCRESILGFRLMSDWWLQERIEPHLITHQRVDLPAVRSRIAEIENHLRHCQGHQRLSRLHGRRVWWREFSDSISVQRAESAALART